MVKKNRNIAYIFLAITALVYFLSAFFVSTSVTHADIGEVDTFINYTLVSTSKVFGDSSIGICDSRTYNRSIYIASSTQRVAKIGSPTTNLIGVIYSPVGASAVIIATSTNLYAPADISTSYTYTHFDFDNVYIASTSPFCIGVMIDGSVDVTNNYKAWSGTTAYTNSNYISSLTATGGTVGSEMYQQVYGYTYFPTSTGGGTIECDMASTTEAVYAVGTTTNFILGIFLCLIFGLLSYTFFKGYIT